MTLSPVQNPHQARPRLDLTAYFLNRVCACPGCEREATDNHHLFRRSLGKGFADAWWVELKNGTVVPNRVGLCRYHHQRITDNVDVISWQDGGYHWMLGGLWVKLDPHPPLEPAKQVEPVQESHVHEGEDCPTCHRRVPHRKKATSPTSKVFTVRVPLDDADTFAEVLDAAAEHLGIKSHKYHRYNALLAGLVMVLQAPEKELRA